MNQVPCSPVEAFTERDSGIVTGRFLVRSVSFDVLSEGLDLLNVSSASWTENSNKIQRRKEFSIPPSCNLVVDGDWVGGGSGRRW